MQYAVCGTVEYVQSIIGKHPELSVVPVLFYIEENVVCHVLVFVHVRAVPFGIKTEKPVAPCA